MGSEAEQAEALYAAPVLAADTVGILGVFRILLDGTAQNWALPIVFNGKWLDLYVDSADDVQWGYSEGASQAITINAISVPGTGNVAAGWTTPSKQFAGKLIPLGTKQKYLNFRSTSTNAGWLVAYISERNQ